MISAYKVLGVQEGRYSLYIVRGRRAYSFSFSEDPETVARMVRAVYNQSELLSYIPVIRLRARESLGRIKIEQISYHKRAKQDEPFGSFKNTPPSS